MKEPHSLYSQSAKLNQLNILKEIAANSKITQAELGNLCRISVAMVNNYLKSLCRRGFLEYHRRSIKNVTYHLTPSGILHLRTLQSEQISEMADLFATAQGLVRDYIVSQAEVEFKRVVVFGTGNLAQIAFHALESTGAIIVGVSSDDPEKIGRDFCGHEVMRSSRIRILTPDAVVVAELPGTEEVLQDLEPIWNHGARLVHLNGSSGLNAFGYSKLDSPLTAAAEPRNF